MGGYIYIKKNVPRRSEGQEIMVCTDTVNHVNKYRHTLYKKERPKILDDNIK